ncbi:hypothetical protein TorRG33x02_005040, partial [Trema orientale]
GSEAAFTLRTQLTMAKCEPRFFSPQMAKLLLNSPELVKSGSQTPTASLRDVNDLLVPAPYVPSSTYLILL